MGTKHHQSSASDPITDPKKRRRVEFSKIDPGVQANECIKIYMISSKEQMDNPDSFCFQPVDLDRFFGEDGKIYGYQGLKVNIWISSVSFHVYADVSFQSKSDGGKGITDLKPALQDIFAENLVEKKDNFLLTFSNDCDYVKSTVAKGELLQLKVPSEQQDGARSHVKSECSDAEVFRVVGTMPVGQLYSRLVPLALLLVDGSSPIDITDERWEILIMVQKEDNQLRLLGFAAYYRFYRYPDSFRLRLSQILVLPPYQHKGYGSRLLEVLYNVAICEDAYDLSIEEPLDSFQHMRICIDVQRLLVFSPIEGAVNSVVLRLKQENLLKKSETCYFGPPPSLIEDVRKSLKINKKQFLQCWEVLIYIGLDPVDKQMESFRAIVSGRIRADVLGKDSADAGKRVVDVPTDYDREMSFVMFRSQHGEASVGMDENQPNQEEQLKPIVDERIKMVESIAQKVSPKQK
ncbi:histone acetyltransferase type B catalytic subunit isoform X2 [Diospyros lotus]|uniref:histone acetyltransferase type B catalytic subunit isoform X2 n=1 Tax=Diospyros lotus TaxID=55363 RepID=UPI00225B69B8|nr:histone acetyltransferase type B catalytic subunit isoform X2 [Diospyros lotus]